MLGVGQTCVVGSACFALVGWRYNPVSLVYVWGVGTLTTNNLYQLLTHTKPRDCWRCGAYLFGPGVGYISIIAPLNSLELSLCGQCATQFCSTGCDVADCRMIVLPIVDSSSGEYKGTFTAWWVVVVLRPTPPPQNNVNECAGK